MARDRRRNPGAPPRWSRRRWLGLGAAAAGLCGALAWAVPMWPYVPPTYNKGDVLSSTTLTAQFKQVGENLNDLKGTITALQAQVAALQAGSPDCPPGYGANIANGVTTCTKGNDVMVKVGTGLAAFWIDKYEASTWSKADGTGTQYGATDANGALVQPDHLATFRRTGQRDPNYTEEYALSKAAVQPSASLTWFQAAQACRASGKRLPTDEEWLAAASGTNDPGANNGAGGACVTQASGARATGLGITCVSAWGAQDMVGNVWEWTSNWYAGTGTQVSVNWPDSAYGSGDGVWNVSGQAIDGLKSWTMGIPAGALRGGFWSAGTQAGVFALVLNDAPSYWGPTVGFRCAAR